jgi:hypothetical protein
MKVSAFLALLVLGLLVAPLLIEAQPRAKIPQVGFLSPSWRRNSSAARWTSWWSMGHRASGPPGTPPAPSPL